MVDLIKREVYTASGHQGVLFQEGVDRFAHCHRVHALHAVGCVHDATPLGLILSAAKAGRPNDGGDHEDVARHNTVHR